MRESKKSKVLTAARSVFLRYGYRRANMNDIAETAGVSRPALYVIFKNEEEVFTGVLIQWINETLEEVEREIATAEMPERKIERAFEVWSVRPFEMTMASPEAKELLECGFDFAQASLRHGSERFEALSFPPYQHLAKNIRQWRPWLRREPRMSLRVRYAASSRLRRRLLSYATSSETS